MSEERALTTISEARRALAECKTLDDFRNFRDVATALRAYLKARGAGIDTENEAAELILRAERGAGAELIRMAEAGERSPQGGPGNPYWGASAIANDKNKPTLRDLGVNWSESFRWRPLALIPDADFEGELREARALNKRIAKTDFYKLARQILGEEERRRPDRKPGDPGAEWKAVWEVAHLALSYLTDLMANGWPLRNDFTPEGWQEVEQQTSDAALALLELRRRVKSFTPEDGDDVQRTG